MYSTTTSWTPINFRPTYLSLPLVFSFFPPFRSDSGSLVAPPPASYAAGMSLEDLLNRYQLLRTPEGGYILRVAEEKRVSKKG